jgi:hypothetical protein
MPAIWLLSGGKPDLTRGGHPAALGLVVTRQELAANMTGAGKASMMFIRLLLREAAVRLHFCKASGC